jgi:hypothetical protein
MLIEVAAANAFEDAMPIPGMSAHKEISARVIQEGAIISPVSYDHAIIVGDLDGKDCRSIEITNSIIRGNVSSGFDASMLFFFLFSPPAKQNPG